MRLLGILVSFVLSMLGIILAIHSPYTWTGLLVCLAGMCNMLYLIPQGEYDEYRTNGRK